MKFSDLPRVSASSARISYAGLAEVVPDWPEIIPIGYIDTDDKYVYFTRFEEVIYAYDPHYYRERSEPVNRVEQVNVTKDGLLHYADCWYGPKADELFPVPLMEFIL